MPRHPYIAAPHHVTRELGYFYGDYEHGEYVDRWQPVCRKHPEHTKPCERCHPGPEGESRATV